MTLSKEQLQTLMTKVQRLNDDLRLYATGVQALSRPIYRGPENSVELTSEQVTAINAELKKLKTEMVTLVGELA